MDTPTGELTVVVFVEDHPVILEYWVHLAQRRGVASVGFETCEDALDYIASRSTKVRAVVTDLDLGHGVMDGAAFVRVLRTRGAMYPIAVVSSHDRSYILESVAGVPRITVAEKPDEPSGYLQVLESLLAL